MTTPEQESADDAFEEVSIISAIIMRLAKYAVDQGEKIDGPELAWLALQLDKAVNNANSKRDQPSVTAAL